MKRNNFTVVLILCIWFVISFVTNILGPIMPEIIDNYHLDLTLAAFLPFSFFLAYGIMSVPAGMLMERYGGRTAMAVAFGTAFLGALLFALLPVYGVALGSLFVIGIGMAMLQVIINPLMRVAGGEEHFAFYSVLAQLVFGAASFVSPYVFVSLVRSLSERRLAQAAHLSGNSNIFIRALAAVVPPDLPWSSLYWVFALIFLILLIAIPLAPLPDVNLKEEERTGPWTSYAQLLKKRQVLLYFLGIVAYVGTEQGLANWMSKFLDVYHGVDPLGGGASSIALFWGLMSVGCLLGLLVLKLWDARKVLRISALLAMGTVSLALFGSTKVSLAAFPACGFFISVMFSIIFSLALNSETRHHGSFSGILCSGIFGGALIPLIIGRLGDWAGLRTAMLFLYLPLGYILSIGFWAKPLIDNKTVRIRDLFKKTVL